MASCQFRGPILGRHLESSSTLFCNIGTKPYYVNIPSYVVRETCDNAIIDKLVQLNLGPDAFCFSYYLLLTSRKICSQPTSSGDSLHRPETNAPKIMYINPDGDIDAYVSSQSASSGRPSQLSTPPHRMASHRGDANISLPGHGHVMPRSRPIAREGV